MITCSASPARSAWASRPSRRCSPTKACRCSTPTPWCTGCRAGRARWSRDRGALSPGTTGPEGVESRRAGGAGARRAGGAAPAGGARPSGGGASARRSSPHMKRRRGVLDIPLLFEKGRRERSTRSSSSRRPADVQRERVLARPGMTRRSSSDPRPPAARRREARPRRLRHRRFGLGDLTRRRAVAASSLASAAPGRFIEAMREIVFDTETTGLSPRAATGWSRSAASRCSTGSRPAALPRYFNPERPMPSEAEAVHGLSDAFLSTSRASPTRRGAARIHRRFAAGRAQCRLRFRLPQSRARQLRPRRDLHDADGRHAGLARQRIPAPSTASTRLCTRFGVDRSSGSSTAPCSTRNCSPRSMSS
jgi:hypothetical protein